MQKMLIARQSGGSGWEDAPWDLEWGELVAQDRPDWVSSDPRVPESPNSSYSAELYYVNEDAQLAPVQMRQENVRGLNARLQSVETPVAQLVLEVAAQQNMLTEHEQRLDDLEAQTDLPTIHDGGILATLGTPASPQLFVSGLGGSAGSYDFIATANVAIWDNTLSHLYRTTASGVEDQIQYSVLNRAGLRLFLVDSANNLWNGVANIEFGVKVRFRWGSSTTWSTWYDAERRVSTLKHDYLNLSLTELTREIALQALYMPGGFELSNYHAIQCELLFSAMNIPSTAKLEVYVHQEFVGRLNVAKRVVL